MSNVELSPLEKKLVDRLIALKPKNLLELGCGDGRKLIYLNQNSDIHVMGIDIYEPFIKDLQKAGIDAQIGDARKLPYPEKSVDWVLIANSLHHVANPNKMISAAMKVAKIGVIVVDPWYDKTIYSQELTAELSAWFKKLHQSLGFFHREGLSAGEIVAAIEDDISELEVYYELILEELEINEFLEPQQQYIKELKANHYLLWELNQIKNKLNGKFLSKPGQVVVIIKK